MKNFRTHLNLLLWNSTLLILISSSDLSGQRVLTINQDTFLLNIERLSEIPEDSHYEYHTKNQIDSAYTFLENLLNPNNNLNDSSKAIVYYKLARIEQLDRVNNENAIKLFEASIQINPIKFSKIQSLSYKALSSIYSNRGKQKTALKYLRKSLKISQKRKAKGELKVIPEYVQFHMIFNQLKDEDSIKKYRMLWEVEIKPLEKILHKEEVQRVENEKEYIESQYEYEKLKVKHKHEEVNLLKAKNKRSIIFWSGLFALFLITGGIYIFGKHRKERRLKLENIEQQSQIEQLLNSTEIKTFDHLVEVQEKERMRISRELHDRIGGMLAMAKVHYQIAEEKLEEYQEQNIEQLKIANELLDKACDETRIISHELAQGEISKFGLIYGLKELVNLIDSTGKYEIEFYDHNWGFPIKQKSELTLYRIVQELLSNILKHAKASYISIQLIHHNDSLALIVEDNGIGFDEKIVSQGIGFKNLEERTIQLKGNLTMDTSPGNGSSFLFEFKTEHL